MGESKVQRTILIIGIILILILSGIPTILSFDGYNITQFENNNDIDWWPMFRHDLIHTGYSTSTAPDTNTIRWRYTTGFLVDSSPAVADGKVYIGSGDGKVYCLNADTGGKIWDCIISYGEYYSSPAVADGKVYIGGSSDGKVYCLNAGTGAYIWDYQTSDAVESSPAIADGKVYIGSLDRKVYCFGNNRSPNKPSKPYPENGSINITTDVNLTWSGGDPDVNDIVTYDVYFGSTHPLQKIASNKSNTLINPGHLAYSLTYFWSIVSWDNHGTSTVGPSWYFTTIEGNNPPNKPSKPVGQINGSKKIVYLYSTNTTDPDGDQVYYMWDWGDDSFSQWLGPYESGVMANASHAWAKGSYSIRVKALDIYGLESDWSDPLEVIMPKSKSINTPLFLHHLFQRFPFFEKILNQLL